MRMRLLLGVTILALGFVTSTFVRANHATNEAIEALTQAPPVATASNALAWDYADTDASTGAVAEFLICVDGQPTAACAVVALASGTASATAGAHTFAWKLPALTPGAHSASVQACTAGAASCSDGATLAFTYQVVLGNPVNLRLVKQ